jgi:hypothetical protein
MKLPSFVVCLACIFFIAAGALHAQRKPTYYIWNGANLQPAYDDPSNMKIYHWEAWLYVSNAATGEWMSTTGRWGSWSEKTIEKLTHEVKAAQVLELELKKWCESCRRSKYTWFNAKYPIAVVQPEKRPEILKKMEEVKELYEKLSSIGERLEPELKDETKRAGDTEDEIKDYVKQLWESEQRVLNLCSKLSNFVGQNLFLLQQQIDQEDQAVAEMENKFQRLQSNLRKSENGAGSYAPARVDLGMGRYLTNTIWDTRSELTIEYHFSDGSVDNGKWYRAQYPKAELTTTNPIATECDGSEVWQVNFFCGGCLKSFQQDPSGERNADAFRNGDSVVFRSENEALSFINSINATGNERGLGESRKPVARSENSASTTKKMNPAGNQSSATNTNDWRSILTNNDSPKIQIDPDKTTADILGLHFPNLANPGATKNGGTNANTPAQAPPSTSRLRNGTTTASGASANPPARSSSTSPKTSANASGSGSWAPSPNGTTATTASSSSSSRPDVANNLRRNAGQSENTLGTATNVHHGTGEHPRVIVNPPKGSIYVALNTFSPESDSRSVAERSIGAGFSNTVIYLLFGSKDSTQALVGPYFDLRVALDKKEQLKKAGFECNIKGFTRGAANALFGEDAIKYFREGHTY